MDHEELIQEYEALHYQLWGRAGYTNNMTSKELQEAIHCMYAQFPAAPTNLTKEY